MSLDEATEQDVLKEVDGVAFIISKNLDQQYDEVKIDFKRTMFKSGFVIKLSNTAASCS